MISTGLFASYLIEDIYGVDIVKGTNTCEPCKWQSLTAVTSDVAAAWGEVVVGA